MPLVQFALQSDFDRSAHVRVGELIAQLRDEGVVIVGSGFSFYDTMGMRCGTCAAPSATFDR